MAKQKTVFICSVCGQQEPQWQGRCHGCGSWNSFEQTTSASQGGQTGDANRGRATTGIQGKEKAHQQAVPLVEIPLPQLVRVGSGFAELDRVLGGGLVPGSVVLLGGEPGIGKSTLLLQIAARLQQRGVLYICAEESALQIKVRAQRLGCGQSRFSLLCSNHLGQILDDIRSRVRDIARSAEKTELIIVDSLQTILEPSLGSVPGTPSQLRHITQVFQDCCREYKLTLLLVAHLTKDGSIAGPRTVEHMVDCVIYFEHGEQDLRILQANKNRFGSTAEMGILQMSEGGLQELESPQQYFLSQREGNWPAGIAIAPVHEGSRSLLVELQALSVPAKGSVSRIFANRLDSARISRLAAVLERHCGIVFSDQDIYINVAGGLRLQDIALDLPLSLALLSARLGRALPQGLSSSAELSLAGELRPIKHEEQRLRSAAEFGIQELILPQKRIPIAKNNGAKNTKTGRANAANAENQLKVRRLSRIQEVAEKIFGPACRPK